MNFLPKINQLNFKVTLEIFKKYKVFNNNYQKYTAGGGVRRHLVVAGKLSNM